jgi:DNA-directed RNA polymerase subunit L
MTPVDADHALNNDMGLKAMRTDDTFTARMDVGHPGSKRMAIDFKNAATCTPAQAIAKSQLANQGALKLRHKHSE